MRGASGRRRTAHLLLGVAEGVDAADDEHRGEAGDGRCVARRVMAPLCPTGRGTDRAGPASGVPVWQAEAHVRSLRLEPATRGPRRGVRGRSNSRSQALPPDYNVAPTKEVYAVVERPPQAVEPEAAGRARSCGSCAGGWCPSWAKDPSIGNRMINARMETRRREAGLPAGVRHAPLPAAGRRLLRVVPTESWQAASRKQPFFIRPADGGVLAMAGLYEIWRDPTVPTDPDADPFLWTCTVITTDGRGRRSATSTTGCR